MTTKRNEKVSKQDEDVFDTNIVGVTVHDISQKLEPLIQLLIKLEGDKARANEQINSAYDELKKQKFDVKKIRQVVSAFRGGQPERVTRPLVDQIITARLGR